MSRYKPKGWRNESQRHSLARKGIKTKSLIPLNKDDPYYYVRKNFPKKDFDGDGIDNRNDCKPLNPYEQGKVHDFFEQLIRTKKKQFPEHKRKLDKAQKDIKKIKTVEGIKKWIQDHKTSLELTGLSLLTIAVAETTGGAGMLMLQISTGEIVAVGGSIIGKTLQPIGVITGGIAFGQSIREQRKLGTKQGRPEFR